MKQQQGATLAVSLVILLVLSLFATTAVNTVVQQEKMSHNQYDLELAFQAAESGLREGESWVFNLNSEPEVTTNCTVFPCVESIDPAVYYAEQTQSWWQTNSSASSTSFNNLATQPRFIVEYERFVPDSLNIGQGVQSGKHYYRITAKGTGATDSALSLLQSTLPRRF